MLRISLVAALLCSSVLAQDYLILTGYSDSAGPSGPGDNSYPVSRFRDLNGDGVISDANELFAFLKKSFNTRNFDNGATPPELASFMSDMDWVQEGDNWAFYVADSGDGRITRGVDENNNGVLDDAEVTEFFDFQSGFAPDGIAVHHDATSGRTRVYVAMDDSGSPYGRGIHRLVDLNGDGDATDAGEQTAFVSSSANLSVTGTGGASVPLVSHFWEQVHTLADGTVVAYSRASASVNVTPTPDQYCWYAFTDNNGTATASVFFNPSRLNGIDTWADFAAGGQYPQWDVVFQPSGKQWNNVEFFAEALPDALGIRDYYFGASYNIGYVHLNPQSTPVHGLIYRWRDINGNFRLDAGELNLFANFSGQAIGGVQPVTVMHSGAPIDDLDERVFGMKATDGAVHLCWQANQKFVTEFADPNGNGVCEPGEARMAYAWTNAVNDVYSAAFGPYVKDFSAFDRGFMPGPFPTGLMPYGQGCALVSNGLSPVCDATGGSPQLANPSFAVALQRLVPSASTAYCFVSLGRQSPALPLPSPPFPSGCNVHVDLGVGFLGSFGPFAADADGVATAPIPIPNAPILVGATLHFQWATAENAPGPRLVLSNALEVTVQP